MRRFKKVKDSRTYQDLDTGEIIGLYELRRLHACIMEYDYDIVYLKYGKNHREDGPAIISYLDEEKRKFYSEEFCLDGFELDKDEWFKRISKENRIKYFFNLADHLTTELNND